MFVLILFACSAGCTSSTAEKEVLTQEEFQEIMNARAATSSPTTVSTPTSTPVPTQTPLAPDFKCSVGDVIADENPGRQQAGWVILDYRSATDEYLIKLIYRNSIEEPWKEVPGENAVWSDRVSLHESWTYHIDREDVNIIWSTPTTAPTAKPTTIATPKKTPTPTPTRNVDNGYLLLDISSSRSTIGNLFLDIADDIDYMDYQSLKTHGERLEQKAQSDYNVISKYAVSSEYQNLKTRYLRVLEASKNAGKYSKLAAEEYIKGNEKKGEEYLNKAQDYMDKLQPDLNAVVREMGW